MLPSLQDTVPVGFVGELEVSTTVEENVTELPEDIVEGLGVTVRVVA